MVDIVGIVVEVVGISEGEDISERVGVSVVSGGGVGGSEEVGASVVSGSWLGVSVVSSNNNVIYISIIP